MPDLGGNDQEMLGPEDDLESDLADDFLKAELPEKSEEGKKGITRTVGEKAIKPRVGSRGTSGSVSEVGVPSAGSSPLIGSNVEEVWDDDPTVPELIEESDEEGEELSGDDAKRVKKIKKRTAEHFWGLGQKTTLWWVLSGFCAILVVGYILQQNELTKNPSAVVEEPTRFVSTISLAETPVSQLLIIGQSAVSQLVEILKKAEEESDGFSELLVGGEESASLMKNWYEKIGEKALVKDDGVIGLLAAGHEGRGYLLMSGLRDDYTKYIAYFVDVDGELRLDWEATEGYSELLPEELVNLEEGEEVELRAVVSASSFYTDLFPEEIYACVLLSHVDRESYAWGYIRRGTPDYERLVNYLSNPVTALTSGRVVIRVSGGPEGALPKQVLITGVLAADWLGGGEISAGEDDSDLEQKEE